MIRTIDFSRTRDSLRPFRASLISPAVGRVTFAFHFNVRCGRDLRALGTGEGAWFFALIDAVGTPLIRARRITISANLLEIHQVNAQIPPGVLRCSGPADPGARDLGLGLCSLVYEEV